MCRGRCYEDIRQYNAVEEGYAWLWGGWMLVLDKVAEKTSMKGWHWRKWEVQARGCLERATKAEGGEIGEALRQGCGVLGVFGKKKLASATGALANFFSPNRGEVMPERCWSLCLLGLVGLGEDCGLYWVRWEVMGKSGLCFQSGLCYLGCPWGVVSGGGTEAGRPAKKLLWWSGWEMILPWVRLL